MEQRHCPWTFVMDKEKEQQRKVHYCMKELSVGNRGFFLTFVSAGIGEDDLYKEYWSCDEEMKPESWEEMLESRAGVCWGRVELRNR